MSVKALPNLLSMGTLALLSTMEQRFQAAVILILAGGVLDLLDGRVDRRLKAASCLGRELDSLADLVSFGVAPAILAYSHFLADFPFIGIPAALAFTVCGVFRLARFNVSDENQYFTGIPISITGGFLAGAVLLAGLMPLPSALFSHMLGMSWLMVSSIKVPSWK